MHPLHSLLLDGRGGARAVPPEGGATDEPGTVHWLHLDHHDDATVAWLRERSGLEEVMVEALLALDPRPRSLAYGAGLLVILRAVNHNVGAEPEDMVSLRIWAEERRVLTLRHRRVHSLEELAEQLSVGNGPTSAGDFLQEVAARVLDHIGSEVEEVEEAADELEEQVLSAHGHELRTRLADLRRRAIAFRRFIAPLRETLGHLYVERVAWLDDVSRARLREAADRAMRYVEDLDETREHAAVTHEELSNRIAEQMNEAMYRLSMVAAIFLPLTLLTGLLGINVGGIPGSDSPIAFSVVAASIVVLGVGGWLWFRRRRSA